MNIGSVSPCQRAALKAMCSALSLLLGGAALCQAQTVFIQDGVGNRASQAAAASTAAPSLVGQPASQLGQVGGTYRFSVVAGGVGPFTYQWCKDAAMISGATTDTLVIANASAASFTNHATNANSYSVKVTNTHGTTASNPAALYLDTNDVGILDWWQTQYFGGIGVDPNADADMDGVSNLQEYLDGTDPNDQNARNFMLTFTDHANLVTVQPNSSRFAANTTANLSANSFGLTGQFGGWLGTDGSVTTDNPLSLTFTASDVTLTPLFGSLPLDSVQPAPAFTFGSGGALVRGFSVAPNGAALVWGVFDQVDGINHLFVVRLLLSGALDPGFNVTPDDVVYGGVVQPDGRVVIVGAFYDINGVPAQHLARLNVDGSLDPSFAGVSGADFDNVTTWVTLQRDGKLLVAGLFSSYGGIPCANLARFNADGTFDDTFSSAHGGATYVVVQPDGKILLLDSVSVTRLNADGSLDSSFLPSSYDGTPTAICLQPNGQILVVGYFDSFNNTALGSVPAAGMVRLNADGSLDAAYTQMVRQNLGTSPSVFDAALQNDGRVILAGTNLDGANLVRLNVDGTLDHTAFSFGLPDNQMAAVATRSDDSVLAGGSFTTIDSQSRNLYARFVTTNNMQPGALAVSPAGPTYAANAPVTLSVTPTASFNPVLSVAFESSADGMSFQSLGQGTGGSGGTWTYPVSALPAGQVYYRAVATDTAQEQVSTLAVGPLTTPPIVTSVLTPQIAYLGTPFTYQATGTGLLTGFTVSGLPAWATGVFDLNTGILTISGTPTSEGSSSLTLRASNAAGTGAASTLVLTAYNSFANYQTQNFTQDELQDPTISGPLGDATGAGIVNLLKYALGIPPKRPGVAGLPVMSVQTISGSRYLTLSYTHDKLASGVTLAVQVGGNLSTWSSGSGSVTEISRTTNSDGGETVVTRDNIPVSTTTSRRFMRLQVSQ